MQKESLKDKPWYFIFVVLSFFVKPIIEKVVSRFVDDKGVDEFLEKTIRIYDIVPWIVGVIILFICLGIFYYQQYKKRKTIVSSSELETLQNTLNRAVNDNEYIESMQAFQYCAKSSSSEKFIKLNHLCGAADERIEINVVFQTYFYFSHSMYKKMKTVSGEYDKYINESEPIRKEKYKNDFLESGHDLCTRLLEQLNKIQDEKDIKGSHCDMYRVLAKLLPTISGKAIEKVLENEQIEDALIKRKKNGMLGSIVLNDLYIFHNANSVTKKDRIYFSFPYNNEKKIVFLGAIDGNDFPAEVEEYCKEVVANICSN